MRLCYLAVFVCALCLAGLVSACGGGSESGSTVASNHQSSRQSRETNRQSRKDEREARRLERQRQKRIAKEERIEAKEHRQARREREAKRQREKKEAQKRAAEKAAKKMRQEQPPGVDPAAAEAFHYFTGVAKLNWENAYGLCAVVPEAQLADELHTNKNIGDIAQAYAKVYSEPSKVAAEEGCLSALINSPAEREAAFKMMEAAEQ